MNIQRGEFNLDLEKRILFKYYLILYIHYLIKRNFMSW